MKFNTLQTLNVTDVLTNVNANSVDLSNAQSLALVAVITNDAPTAKTFTADAATDNLTIASHGYKTGLKVQVSSATTLPGGLAATTDYFVIRVDANTVKLASTYANAVAGTAIDITSAGTGTHTMTPTALAGASIVPQYSIDGSTWINLEAPTSITGSVTYTKLIDRPAYNYIRLVYTLTAGQLTTENKVSIKV